jgi:hypothetical protein
VILIDAAVGSNEFEDPLRKLGLPVQVTHLDSGDFAFLGRGEGGTPLLVGIEFKKIGELAQSLNTERLQGHQLLEMVNHYDRRYLIIEGDYHCGSNGDTVVFRGKGAPTRLPGSPPFVVLEQRLFNLQTRGGLITKHTPTRSNTLRVIVAWYRYWTDKDLDDHKSHLAVYAPDIDDELFVGVSDFRRAVKVLCPGIGDKGTKGVEAACKESMWQLCQMNIDEIANIDIPIGKEGKTKKLGRKRATATWFALRGRAR